MTRPIALDVSHLAHRLRYGAPSGIEKVDLAYATHFSAKSRIAAGVQYGIGRPRLMSAAQVGALVASVRQKWASDIALADDARFQRIRRWLTGADGDGPNLGHRDSPLKDMAAKSYTGLRRALAPTIRPDRSALPHGAIYLNVAQHALEKHFYFSWLAKRPDVKAVFFVHDLLPLQEPQFWPADHLDIFRRRIACVTRHASAIVTTSGNVEAALREAMKGAARPDAPILAAPFPSPLALSAPAPAPGAELADANYFVVVNTIEPRKNHRLLLDVWRELAKAGPRPPKLVMIGKRGWKYEEVTGAIAREPALRALIIEAAGLSDAGLRALIAGANALLAPSFAEGYGLPIVEALTLRTPVIASDIPVFREVSQQRAVFRDAGDVGGWVEAAQALSRREAPLARAAREAANAYVPMTGEEYFAAIEAFLGSL